ncbi:LysM domain-containing protein [Modestobacter sp. DSM 44400]|uniref:CIS tube protein n=1 Tax=Modestobacter sp. DSM 44400 TaxID=1550230 RepID=UPI00089522B9|nr:LysM peptidoglycan-binding domain-containing protein [Modestobacter sp. DSM 44400]SDY48333.1 LysM domain-containing protein [Modestobacter sp. DSM 44400]
MSLPVGRPRPVPLALQRHLGKVSNTHELAKAVLINTSTGAGHPVMYNPEEIKLEQGNQFAEVGIPGLGASPLQYVRGRNRVLAMELFFDTYESGEDVRAHTAPIVQLLDQDPQTLAPPVLLFSLGKIQFRCVLTDAGQRFTMFARDGTPVRSTMSVRLQEYVEVSVEVRQGVFLGSPTLSGAVNAGVAAATAAVGGSAAAETVMHMVLAGDTLSGIAAAYLGDAARWRDIAQANRIVDPFGLVVGTALVLPLAASTAAATGPGARP